MLPPIGKVVQRVQIGVLEEYFQGSIYLGHRAAQSSEQGFGSEHMRTFELEEDLVIQRSFSKTRTLKKGETVTRMISPLEGREIR